MITPAQHIKHAMASLRYSIYGITATFKTEMAFKQEVAGLIALPIIAYLLGFPIIACCFVVIAWLLVMLTELLNTAIEHVCNKVSPEKDPFIKLAKDAGSAAVLVALVINLVLWVSLFYTYW